MRALEFDRRPERGQTGISGCGVPVKAKDSRSWHREGPRRISQWHLLHIQALSPQYPKDFAESL